MTTHEMCAQIADIVHPVADWEIRQPKDVAPEGEVENEPDPVADAKRAQYLDHLLIACDAETRAGGARGFAENAKPAKLSDPLLLAVQDVAGHMRVLQDTLYQLIAYARELSPPGRKYTLKALAEAAGMSTSGIGTCYNEATTARAAENLQFGAIKRDGADDPRWRVARFGAQD